MSRGTVLIALGLDRDGKSMLLDWMGCDCESCSSWVKLFRKLYNRELLNPEIIVSDGEPGIIEAMNIVWKPKSVNHFLL